MSITALWAIVPLELLRQMMPCSRPGKFLRMASISVFKWVIPAVLNYSTRAKMKLKIGDAMPTRADIGNTNGGIS
jgi:hypothetical protein